MEITLLHVADCPNLTVARTRAVEAAKLAGVETVVIERLVHDSSEAAALGFIGSPTILVDGSDPFPTADSTPSLACRLYATGDGIQGAPSVDDLVEVLSSRAAGTQPEQ